MSNKMQDAVRCLALPRGERVILLAYANRASYDGKDAYPSIDRLAYETGYERRQVQRLVKSLVEAQLLIPEGTTRGGRGVTTNYRVCPENGVKMSPFQKYKKGDICDAKRVTSTTLKGDITNAPPIRNGRAEPSEPLLEPAAAENATEEGAPIGENGAAAAVSLEDSVKDSPLLPSLLDLTPSEINAVVKGDLVQRFRQEFGQHVGENGMRFADLMAAKAKGASRSPTLVQARCILEDWLPYLRYAANAPPAAKPQKKSAKRAYREFTDDFD